MYFRGNVEAARKFDLSVTNDFKKPSFEKYLAPAQPTRYSIQTNKDLKSIKVATIIIHDTDAQNAEQGSGNAQDNIVHSDAIEGTTDLKATVAPHQGEGEEEESTPAFSTPVYPTVAADIAGTHGYISYNVSRAIVR